MPTCRIAAPIRFAVRHALLPLIAVLAMLAFAQPASAQVPLVPDAITTPDLQPIIETLGLSDQQALTLLPIHDAYKERYRTFLDTEVKELQDELVEIGLRFTRGAFEIPARKELEAIISKFKRLLDKSRGLDRTFFVEIGGILAEEQQPLLERARINRELKVFRDILGGVGEMNRGTGVNLGEMVRRFDLSPQEREQIEPVLAEYDASLLSKSNVIYNVLTDAADAVLDFIDESGVRNMTLEQMAAMAQNPPPGLLQRAETVFDDASKPIQEAAWDLSQMNMRMYRRLVPLLSDEHGRDLRDLYFRRAYREIYSGDSMWEARYRAALRLEELNDDQRTTLTEQRAAFVLQHDAAIDSGVAALEASRQYKSFKQFTQQEPDPAAAKVEDTVARRKTVEEQALTTLNSVLGETLVALLDEKLKKEPELAREDRGRVRMTTRSRPVGGGDNGNSGEVRVEVAASEIPVPAEGLGEVQETAESRYLPAAMSIPQFEQVLTSVGMSEDDRAVAMTLFDAYRTEYVKRRIDPLEITKAAEEATPAETGKARTTRHEELIALDAGLFDDLALLAHDDAAKNMLQTMRLTRQRQAASDSSKAMAQSFGEDEAYIDIVSLIAASDVTPDDRKAAAESLQDYDARVSTYVSKRLDAAREVQRRSDSMQRAGRRGGGGGGGLGGGGGNQAMEFAVEKWRDARKSLRETNDKITSVNRELLAEIIAKMPTDAAWQLKLAYNQAAYPEIFRDDRSAEKTIQGALSMSDLDDTQRERINEVAAQFRGDFYALCEQMVSLRQQREIDFLGGQMPKKEDIDREIELEKMRWNRNEISARARLRLSLILTDDQSKSLPELQAR